MSRRRLNSATIVRTGVVIALAARATPASCTNDAVQEFEFTMSRVTCSARSARHHAVAQAPARHGVRLREAVEQDRALCMPGCA
jgi:hypothetical protein